MLIASKRLRRASEAFFRARERLLKASQRLGNDFGGFIVDFKMNLPVHTNRTTGNVNDHVNDHVNDSVKTQKLVDIIRKNPVVTLDQLTLQLMISKSTVYRYIKILKKSNQLIRKGSDKSGVWEIIAPIIN